MLLAHLAEVRLAGQSSQVTEKNQQQISIELFGKIDRLAVEIQQRQVFYRNVFHDSRENSLFRIITPQSNSCTNRYNTANQNELRHVQSNDGKSPNGPLCQRGRAEGPGNFCL
jgi:hypothetical protein